MPNDTMQNDQNVSSIENVYELPPEQVNTASLEIDFLQSSSELEQKAGTSDCIPINFFSTIKPRDPIVIPPSGIVAHSVLLRRFSCKQCFNSNVNCGHD